MKWVILDRKEMFRSFASTSNDVLAAYKRLVEYYPQDAPYSVHEIGPSTHLPETDGERLQKIISVIEQLERAIKNSHQKYSDELNHLFKIVKEYHENNEGP